MSKLALDKVAATFPHAFVERYDDRAKCHWGVVKPESLREVVAYLKGTPALSFQVFLSCDAVDRLLLADEGHRFEVAYFLRSLARNEVVRLKVRLPADAPEVPSLVAVFQGANWWERLVWDFYGIRFAGHPDLRRILLYEEFEGHPLRKDYPLRGRQPLIPERPIQDIFRGPGANDVSR